jgi:glycogen operon protein
VDRLRTRYAKNLFTATMLSAGMPMMAMGDEVRRTQRGNNNAYCQDNETSWFDWSLLTKRADLLRFVTTLNAYRVRRDAEYERQRVPLSEIIRQSHLTWHGVRLNEPDWGTHSHSVAFTLRLPGEPTLLHVIVNAWWEALDFELPLSADGRGLPWRRWIDTYLESPQDIVEWEEAPVVDGHRYRAAPRSVVGLFAESSGT